MKIITVWKIITANVKYMTQILSEIQFKIRMDILKYISAYFVAKDILLSKVYLYIGINQNF